MMERGDYMNHKNKINNFFYGANNKLTKIQFLSGNAIKIIAICLMFFDHFNKTILLWYSNNVLSNMEEMGKISIEAVVKFNEFIRFQLYPIGSIAFPLFCFLISEGFFYTKNRKRYFVLMGTFALLSEIPLDLAFFRSDAIVENTFPFYWGYQNVFFTLLLGLIALWCIEKFKPIAQQKNKKIKARFLQITCVVGLAVTASLIHSDYEAYGVFLIVAFYLCRKNRLYQMLAFLLVYMVSTNAQPAFPEFTAILILLLYNGQRGKLRLKYFFYIFYPAHLMLLYVTTLLLPRFF